MSSLSPKAIPRAVAARCIGDELVVSLNDGHILSVPLIRFPRLAHAAPK